MNRTNRNPGTALHQDHARARGAPGPALFREWQHADALASAARRRVRDGSVADGHGISDAEVCDALVKERRAGALADQLLQQFGADRDTRDRADAR